MKQKGHISNICTRLSKIEFLNYRNRLLLSTCFFFMYVLRLFMEYMHQKSMRLIASVYGK